MIKKDYVKLEFVKSNIKIGDIAGNRQRVLKIVAVGKYHIIGVDIAGDEHTMKISNFDRYNGKLIFECLQK